MDYKIESKRSVIFLSEAENYFSMMTKAVTNSV